MFESLTKGKNADTDKAQEIAVELENLKPVNRLTLNITDCTPESLTAELADNNELMGILDDECGIFDNIAKFAGAGTLVPITGFANAVAAPAIDSKNEGFVLGVGAKMFTIAGPVIVYGTVASVVYGVIYWITTLF